VTGFQICSVIIPANLLLREIAHRICEGSASDGSALFDPFGSLDEGVGRFPELLNTSPIIERLVTSREMDLRETGFQYRESSVREDLMVKILDLLREATSAFRKLERGEVRMEIVERHR
jgi:hypothetical protein